MMKQSGVCMDTLINKRVTAVLIVWLICVAVSVLYVMNYVVKRKQTRMEHAGYVASEEINKLQYAIDSRIVKTEILRLILIEQKGTMNDFNSIAEKIYADDPSIRSIQLAPNGVVTMVYPLQGNENAFVDLFHDEKRRAEAEYARDSGKTTLAGPLELYQGGLGIIARTPVFLSDSSGSRSFWGFSIIILNLPKIFDQAGIDYLSNRGYDYRIWRRHSDTGEIQIIDQSISGEMKDPVEQDIIVPNGTWTLSLVPKKGWVPVDYWLSQAVFCFIICCFSAVIFYGFLIVEKQKKTLFVLANTDPLTGLHNERCFVAAINRLTDSSHPFGLLYLDIDKFKLVNDNFGHDMGDRLLIEIAARMRGQIGKNDMAFRIGGDEFAILIREKKEKAYYESLKKSISEAIGEPFVVELSILYPKASCGYARYPEDQTDGEALIKQADQEMYKAKNQIS